MGMCDEKMNVMIVANMNYVKPLRVFLYSLFEHNPCEMDVYMLQSDIDDNTLGELTHYCEHWEGKRLVPIKAGLERFVNFHVTDDFPAEVYLKLLSADILPENLSKVLCLDLDMVVNKPLNGLYNTDIGGYPLAACKDIYGYIYGCGQENIRRMGINEKCTYFNGGMLLLNLDYLRSGGFGMKMCEYAKENAYKLTWNEQDVWNYFFDEKYLKLGWQDYNCAPVMYIMKMSDVQNGQFEPLYQSDIMGMTDFEGFADYTQALSENASIIHYIGETKPWKTDRPQSNTYRIFDRFYNEYEAAANALFVQIQKNQ
jgi:lipopolysaccharide biosynthesis glycosyltransferase